ncbi:hypothetical protein DFH11DRAFT_1515854, partial [Phellopilus nigrolimitatus]
DSLARPSTYMGLEKLKYDPAEEAQRVFANFPFLLTQISEAEPKRVWPDDPIQRLTSIGTVSPDTRHFMLTPKISSVAQFRAVDFGYENCSLHFALQVSSTEELPLQGVAVDIWTLDAPTRLDAAHISWSSRPPRKELYETLTFFPNTSTTSDRTWKCAWGEFQTFEFACAQRGEQERCNVDFWQSPKISTLGELVCLYSLKIIRLTVFLPGVTLTQRSSLA